MFAALAAPRAVQAQWTTQSVTLKPGWNAVYLHVDASYTTLDALVASAGNPAPNVSEVWLWQPATSTVQFMTTPQQSTVPNSQWKVWTKSATPDTLTALVGNGAYLVNNTGSVDFTWNILGKPVAPRYQWTTTGLNFVGFPTPAGAAPKLDVFLDGVPDLNPTALEIFQYLGGDLGQYNPRRVDAPLFRFTPVTRGQAFWMRSTEGAYNRYFGPLDLTVADAGGVDFGDSRSTASVRLRNTTSRTNTYTLKLVASGTAPAGQAGSVGTPPLLVRGPRSAADLTYTHTTLTTAQDATNHVFVLSPAGTPGADVEVVLGLDRASMTGAAGQTNAAILRFADTGGLSQVDIGVVARVADTSGLWVGDATVTQVGQYLVSYPKGADGQPALGTLTTAGQPYVATATNTALTAVSRAVPLRLIVHNDAGHQARLLQRVYYGVNAENTPVLATQESVLGTANRAGARRLSAAHLPFSHANTSWPGTGGLTNGGTVAFTVLLDYNDHASNPFLHTFHPDHDNLNPTFSQVQARGLESYTVSRAITLLPTAPGTDFASLTAGGNSFTGVYRETMTVLGRDSDQRQFTLQGSFSLKRLTPLSTLTSPP